MNTMNCEHCNLYFGQSVEQCNPCYCDYLSRNANRQCYQYMPWQEPEQEFSASVFEYSEELIKAKMAIDQYIQTQVQSALKDVIKPTVQIEVLNAVVPEVQKTVDVVAQQKVSQEVQEVVQPTVKAAVKTAVRQTMAEAADSTYEQILTTVKTIADKFNSPLSVFTV